MSDSEMDEDNKVHRVPVVVFVEVHDAVNVKDAERIAVSSVHNAMSDMAPVYVRGQVVWRLAFGYVASIRYALEKGWLTLFSSERAYGPVTALESQVVHEKRLEHRGDGT